MLINSCNIKKCRFVSISWKSAHHPPHKKKERERKALVAY